MNPVILITGLVYCVIFFVEVRQWRMCPDRHAEIIGWAMVAVHVAIYTIVYIYLSTTTSIPQIVFNIWSTILRLHGGITILSISWARYLRMEKRRGC